MRSPRLSLVALVAALVVPSFVGSADASPSQWAGSSFDPPLDAEDVSVDVATITVSGTFRLEKAQPTDQVVQAELDSADDPDDAFTPTEGCTLPGPLSFDSDGNDLSADEDSLPFSAPFHFDCNGRYLVTATGLSNTGAGESYSMSRSVLVEVTPEPVTSLSVAVDENGLSTISWAEPALAPDSLGYVVERAGPADESGDVGTYDPVAEVDLDSRVVEDQLPGNGTYKYRVRARRTAVAGEVLSSILATATDEAVWAAPTTTTTAPPTTTTTTKPPPQVGTAVPTTQAPRMTAPPVPTTLDTGFEETLDYGSRTVTEVVEVEQPPALVGEELGAGQSIIQDENDGGVDLLVPAAGALVMLLWAGHFAYLNRLAKEL